MATPISLYRTLHRTIRRLPSPHSSPNLLAQLRSTYEVNSTASPPDVPTLLEKGSQNLSYLKMISGGRRKSSSSSPSDNNTGTYVFSPSDNKVINGRASGHGPNAKYSNWHGGNLDPDSVKTHRRQLSRAGFTNNRSVIGDLF